MCRQVCYGNSSSAGGKESNTEESVTWEGNNSRATDKNSPGKDGGRSWCPFWKSAPICPPPPLCWEVDGRLMWQAWFCPHAANEKRGQPNEPGPAQCVLQLTGSFKDNLDCTRCCINKVQLNYCVYKILAIISWFSMRWLHHHEIKVLMETGNRSFVRFLNSSVYHKLK